MIYTQYQIFVIAKANRTSLSLLLPEDIEIFGCHAESIPHVIRARLALSLTLPVVVCQGLWRSLCISLRVLGSHLWIDSIALTTLSVLARAADSPLGKKILNGLVRAAFSTGLSHSGQVLPEGMAERHHLELQEPQVRVAGCSSGPRAERP